MKCVIHSFIYSFTHVLVQLMNKMLLGIYTVLCRDDSVSENKTDKRIPPVMRIFWREVWLYKRPNKAEQNFCKHMHQSCSTWLLLNIFGLSFSVRTLPSTYTCRLLDNKAYIHRLLIPLSPASDK